MLDRRLLVGVAFAFVVLLTVVATLVASGSLTLVPDVRDATDLTAASALLGEAGFRVEANRDDGGPMKPLGVEGVVGQSPSPGWPWVRGMTVVLMTEPDEGDVSMPDLLGRFETDARAILNEVGLSPSNPESEGASTSVVISQEPQPGTQVPFGASVSYEASFPHGVEETNPAVVELHGLLYLRYGLEGMEGACGVCHTASTCTVCHDEVSYDRLETMAPERP